MITRLSVFYNHPVNTLSTAMDELDADDHMLRSPVSGKCAERDIVQVSMFQLCVFSCNSYLSSSVQEDTVQVTYRDMFTRHNY